MIKLISSDMDGTLLDSYRQITPINVEAIKRAQENGINFIINTGRISKCTRSCGSSQIKMRLNLQWSCALTKMKSLIESMASTKKLSTPF